MDWMQIEAFVYWPLFVASFLGVAVWETCRARRNLSVPAETRWGKHSLVWAAGNILSSVLYGLTPVIVAASVEGGRLALLNPSWLPFTVRCILGFLLLDLARYAIHRAWHSFPLLWRVHQVHHSDPEMDLSTTFRVHPIEVIATYGAYLAVVAVVAPPPLVVVFYELSRVFLGVVAHANAALPAWIEKPARAVFITPDLHRIHHSEEEAEQGKNLGETFSWWDRLFHTYAPEPRAGQAGMNTGLRGYRNKASLGLTFILAQPFLLDRSGDAAPATSRTATD
jgi:sterol desaturase/sphingolipid hydroxylase (fatty acid hydroxylase superfamily)